VWCTRRSASEAVSALTYGVAFCILDSQSPFRTWTRGVGVPGAYDYPPSPKPSPRGRGLTLPLPPGEGFFLPLPLGEGRGEGGDHKLAPAAQPASALDDPPQRRGRQALTAPTKQAATAVSTCAGDRPWPRCRLTLPTPPVATRRVEHRAGRPFGRSSGLARSRAQPALPGGRDAGQGGGRCPAWSGRGTMGVPDDACAGWFVPVGFAPTLAPLPLHRATPFSDITLAVDLLRVDAPVREPSRASGGHGGDSDSRITGRGERQRDD